MTRFHLTARLYGNAWSEPWTKSRSDLSELRLPSSRPEFLMQSPASTPCGRGSRKSTRLRFARRAMSIFCCGARTYFGSFLMIQMGKPKCRAFDELLCSRTQHNGARSCMTAHGVRLLLIIPPRERGGGLGPVGRGSGRGGDWPRPY